MRITIILFLFIYNMGLSQEFSDPSTARTINPFSFIEIIGSVNFENSTYVLYQAPTPKINIGGINFESATDCILCSRNYLVKYNSKNKIEKVKEIRSVIDGYGFPTPKLYEANGHLFLTGSSKGNIIIDSIEIMKPTLEGIQNGIMLEFDIELNFIKKYELESGGEIMGIVFKNGNYIIAGIFGDTILQYKNLILRHKTKQRLDWDLREAFLMKIDAKTGEPIRGITFGGTGDSTIDNFSINNNGDLVMVGISGEFVFEYQDLKFYTDEYPFNYSKYIMSITSDFDFIFFNEIESNSEFRPPFEIEIDNEGGIYYLGKFQQDVIINEDLKVSEFGYFTLLMKFSKEGELKWQKVLRNVNIKSLEVDNDNNIWTSGYYRDTTIIDGVVFLPVQYNKSANVVLLSFDSKSGRLLSHDRIGSPMPFAVIDFKIRDDNTLLFMTDISLGISVAINHVDKIFYNALNVDHADLLFFNYKRAANAIEETQSLNAKIYPNPCPFGGTINVSYDALIIKPCFATIYDQIGKKIKTINLTESNHQITCGDCRKGIYFLLIQSEKNNKTLSLIIY